MNSKMKVSVIGDKDTVTGFRLAGIDGRVATSKEDAVKAIEENSDAGILIINEKIASLARDSLDDMSIRDFPLVVEIPDREGPSGEDRIAEIFKQAVGLEMKK